MKRKKIVEAKVEPKQELKKRGRKPKEQYKFKYFTVYKDINELKKCEDVNLIGFIKKLTEGESNIAIFDYEFDSEFDLEFDIHLSEIEDELIELENKKCEIIIFGDIAILQGWGKTLYLNTTDGIKHLNFDNKFDNKIYNLMLLQFIADLYSFKSVNIITSNNGQNISIVQSSRAGYDLDGKVLYLDGKLWESAQSFGWASAQSFDNEYTWMSFDINEQGNGFYYNINENIKEFDLHCQYLINRANNVELDLADSYKLSQSYFNERGNLYYYIKNNPEKYSNEQKLYLMTRKVINLYSRLGYNDGFTVYEIVAEFELK